MTDDDEHLAVEIAQFVQHVHDMGDLLAERIRSLQEASPRHVSTMNQR